MRVALSWIRDFNDCDLPAEEIADILTRAGLEVESIDRVGVYSHEVVVGEILEVEDIDGTKLRKIELDLGDDQRATAVTGAPNIDASIVGKKVPVATPGAILIDAKSEEFALLDVAARDFRGIASNAVLCSLKELGVSDDHSGVLVLEDDMTVGDRIAKVLEPSGDIAADIVLEIAILPNYGRCLSIVGMAREIAGLTRTNFKLELAAEPLPLDPKCKSFDVKIEAPDIAPRYSGFVLKGVEVKPSPEWMQRRLALSGLKPINNLVDVTNYVMLELGQPMHAFDLDTLPAQNITVRRARPGETMYTLDQVTEDTEADEPRELDESILLITSGDEPVAVAGVMGGLHSQVRDETKNLLLESANFDFIAIRKAMSKLKLITDSSTRFSRQVDPSTTVVAIQRSVNLLREVAGAEPEGAIADCYPTPAQRRSLTVKVHDISRTIGVQLTSEEVGSALARLGFTIEESDEHEVTIGIPGFRPDVTQTADVAEEVIRIIGFDRLEPRMLHEPLPRQTKNPQWELRKKVRGAFVGCGLHDCVNYSLTTPAAEARLLAGEAEKGEEPPYVTLLNPGSQERSSMRRTILGSLLENVVRNHRNRERIALFEIGSVFLPEKSEGKLPLEVQRAGVILSGPVAHPTWREPKPRASEFHDLKGIVVNVLEKLHVADYQFVPAKGAPYHPGVAAALVVNGEAVGTLGQIHPNVIEAYDLDDRVVFAADFEVDKITASSSSLYPFRRISRYPAVRQDLALVVNDHVPAADVLQALQDAAGPLLTEIRLFDLFTGEQLGEGKKSLAFELAFCAEDRSLAEKEINELREAILGPLEEKLGAVIR